MKKLLPLFILPLLSHAQSAIHAAPVDADDSWQWQTVASGLNRPWALAFLPDGRYLVTERRGDLRIVDSNGAVGKAISGLPHIEVSGQGGLLDLVLDENFASNRRLYFCFSEPGAGGNSTALAEATLSADGSALENVRVLHSQQPKAHSNLHFGCRIVLDGEHIFLSTGDRYHHREQAQHTDNELGKILRLKRDGSAADGNPFANAVWSYGHRNVQGMTLDSQGRLWAHEHGAQGGDEINRIAGGNNYGWPVIAYGVDYGGGAIGSGKTAQEGMEQPVYYWDPSIAPSGMVFVGENPYGADWQGNLLVGALKFEYLARLIFDGERIVREERFPIGERVRDVRQSPDGHIYIITDASNGKILKLLPKKS